jgi:hypothetical protein
MMGELVMAISNDIMELVRAVMDSDIGINRKIGDNTLSKSDIYNSLSVKATNDGDLVFDILLNDYLTFIESGRRQGAKMPPIEPIVKWARKHDIPTDNSTIYLIRRAISRDGIQPRPFMSVVFEEIDRKWESQWSDGILNEIIKIIDDFFNKQ